MTDLIEKIADTIEPWLEENDRSQMKVAQDVIKTIEAEGYRIVPVKPTRKMYDAYVMAGPGYRPNGEIRRWPRRHKCKDRWKAMLDAAPKVGE